MKLYLRFLDWLAALAIALPDRLTDYACADLYRRFEREREVCSVEAHYRYAEALERRAGEFEPYYYFCREMRDRAKTARKTGEQLKASRNRAIVREHNECCAAG